jgi:hypothetical protein
VRAVVALLESHTMASVTAKSPPNPTVGDGQGPPYAISSWRMLLNEIGSPKQEALADWSCSGVVGLISPLIMSVFSFHAFSKAKPYFISDNHQSWLNMLTPSVPERSAGAYSWSPNTLESLLTDLRFANDLSSQSDTATKIRTPTFLAK